jgi:hypothetical protein
MVPHPDRIVNIYLREKLNSQNGVNDIDFCESQGIIKDLAGGTRVRVGTTRSRALACARRLGVPDRLTPRAPNVLSLVVVDPSRVRIRRTSTFAACSMAGSCCDTGASDSSQRRGH